MSASVLAARKPLVVEVPSAALPESGALRCFERAWETAATKVRDLVEQHPDDFPLYTQGGRWVTDGEAWTNWCEGFLGGQLWLLAPRAGDWYRAKAEHYSQLIKHRKDDESVHDLGFLFWPTWHRWHEATGRDELDAVVVRAGQTMGRRFNTAGRYLRSFLAADSIFIDIMMNVGIVFHAALQTDDVALAEVATQHCHTTRRYLVRGDGSTAHEALFDLGSGQFLRQTTQQGWRSDGSWARGQGWAIHGFGTAYRYTGDRRFLATARACADFYIERTGDRLVPPNDWEEPDPAVPYESSAAAVAASGMWQLAGLISDEEAATLYGRYALRILQRLCEPEFLAADDPAWEGVLKHGIYHQAKGLGVDESVMWGDYWFLEALDQVENARSRGRS
ncbi:MAG TPA: hypothetical protein VF218_00750 [Acidothermaceae bacterium]|jgi:unsaturated chondroitin disaccharide hydrolase